METLNTNSLIKVITSGNIPTTSNLLKGEIAYGLISGENRLFGNNGTSILEFSGKTYSAGTGIAISGTYEISTYNVPESVLNSALQTKINNVLFKDNSTSFTPTEDYNPATKKYVDDQFQAVMDIANGKTTAVVFDTVEQLQEWLDGSYTHPSGMVVADLNIGDLLLIREPNSFDYWWDGTEPIALSDKIDITDYYTKSEANAKFATDIQTYTLGNTLGLRLQLGDGSFTTVAQIPFANNTVRGTIMLAQAPADATLQTASTTAGRFYPVNLTTAGVAYVNVPWIDTSDVANIPLLPDADQPIEVSGTAGAVVTTITSLAVVTDKGLKVENGQITLDPDNIEIVFTVVEI